MTLQEFKDILNACRIEIETDYNENTLIKDLQLDSLDSSMVKYEIESELDREVKFIPDQTIGQLLATLGNEDA